MKYVIINLRPKVQVEYIAIIVVESQQEIVMRQGNIKKTILRRSMKLQAIKLLGGKCCKCGYNKCVDALEFHHQNPYEKEFKLGSGNTMSWKEYKAEALKCILVCSNCHKEIHSELGYSFN